MKITHIMLALESIKKENDEVIVNNKIKIEELEKEFYYFLSNPIYVRFQSYK